MNKADKRQRSIRNKLMAAIAMLLVASIMTVSTTYAWFTLSTAPEVQGITTTVGANGNLEIALASSDENGDIKLPSTSAVGDSTKNVTVRNLTWGNLLDMSDTSYGLGEITLLPSRLNVTPQYDGNDEIISATLGDTPLKTPVYGNDGRIESLETTVVFGAKDPHNASVEGFMENNYLGVRAIGTSSSMTPEQINFNTALGAINSNRVVAKNLVEGAVKNYGSALVSIAVKYAANDTTGYEAYKGDVKNMLTELRAAEDAAEEALWNALLALACTAEVQTAEADAGGTAGAKYNAVKADKDAGNTLQTAWTNFGSTYIAMADGLQDAYDEWTAINTALTAAQSDYDAHKDDATWNDTVIMSVMTQLMNTQGVSINGMTIADVKRDPFQLVSHISNLSLELGEDSGLFANFGALVGDVSGTCTIADGTVVHYSPDGGTTSLDMDVGGVKMSITTTTEPEGGAYLTQVRVDIGKKPLPTAQGVAVTPIDVTYGYAVDFLFRTNVANSDLMLQTEGVDRVYEDNTENPDTMGHGSTMTFEGTYSEAQSLLGLMDALRVVFTGTKNNDGYPIYGIAKLAVEEATALTLPGYEVTVTTTNNQDGTTSTGRDVAPTETVLNATVALVDGAVVWGIQAIGETPAHAVEITEVRNITTNALEGYDWKVITYNLDANTGEPDTTSVASETIYYVELDTEIEVEAYLCLYNYTLKGESEQSTKDVIDFGTKKASQNLCTLPQNTPTLVSAWVYLDGDYVDNTHVGNSETGIALTGDMNLQFSSSATLVPMENSDLRVHDCVDGDDADDLCDICGAAIN